MKTGGNNVEEAEHTGLVNDALVEQNDNKLAKIHCRSVRCLAS